MKYISSFWLLLLITLYSCGQTGHKPIQISASQSKQLKFYEQQSVYYQLKKPDSAVYFADKGLKLSRKLNYLPGEASMLNRMARINEHYGNAKLAIKYQKKALYIFNQLSDTLSILQAATDLGFLEGNAGNYLKGVNLIDSTLKVYLKRNDTANLIKTYTLLGSLSEVNKKHQEAMSFYKQAERLSTGSSISSERFLSLINSIGKLHSKSGSHQLALKYYEKGIDQSNNTGNLSAHITFLNLAGETMDTLGNKSKALEYHQKALQKAKLTGMHEEQARSLMGIAKVLKNEDANMSITHLKNALAIAHSIGYKHLSAEIYHSLSEIYRQQSRYDQALNALEEHHRLLDSLISSDKNHKINVLQKSYELTESRLLIENLELANLRKTYQRNVIIFIVMAVLVILIVLAVYFYKSKQLNKKLKAANQIKDKLFTIIGHDLRNPIGSITALLAMMETHPLTPEEQRLMIGEMRKQGDTSLEILNSLLSWGTAQLNGIKVNAIQFNTKEIITKNIIALSALAKQKQLIINDLSSTQLVILGDADHFDFIIRNLISNAIKFSHISGQIEINDFVDDKNNKVIFSVKDFGKGISYDQQVLFKTSSLDVSFGTNGEKGTGIGLMLSKEFVKANQGSIWIESEEGKGTTFYFNFPLLQRN